MDFQRLDSLAQQYMKHRKSHKEREMGAAYFHGQRVANSVILLREKLFPKQKEWDDVLRCAGMFHDIGKGIEPHAHSGAVLVRDLLKNELTGEELEQVCNLIAVHPDRKPGTNTYTDAQKLLQDADLLDHYGSQGIWMSCIYYAYTGQEEMAQVPSYYASDFLEHATSNRELLNFELSKKIYDEKIAFEQAIAKRMDIESKGFYV